MWIKENARILSLVAIFGAIYLYILYQEHINPAPRELSTRESCIQKGGVYLQAKTFAKEGCVFPPNNK
jgi:hypothetical protein